MGLRAQCHISVAEDLVFVMVNDQTGCARQEVVPGVGRRKSIVNHHGDLALATYRVVSTRVEVFCAPAAGWQGAHQRLIQELNTDHHVSVPFELLRDLVDDAVGERYCVSRGESGSVSTNARVVKAVLAERCSMQINPNLEPGLTGPADSLSEIVASARDVGVARVLLECPVADRNSDQVHATRRDLLKVGQGCPCFPMLLQFGCSVRYSCTKAELVDGGTAMRLEQRWRYPRLED